MGGVGFAVAGRGGCADGAECGAESFGGQIVQQPVAGSEPVVAAVPEPELHLFVGVAFLGWAVGVRHQLDLPGHPAEHHRRQLLRLDDEEPFDAVAQVLGDGGREFVERRGQARGLALPDRAGGDRVGQSRQLRFHRGAGEPDGGAHGPGQPDPVGGVAGAHLQDLLQQRDGGRGARGSDQTTLFHLAHQPHRHPLQPSDLPFRTAQHVQGFPGAGNGQISGGQRIDATHHSEQRRRQRTAGPETVVVSTDLTPRLPHSQVTSQVTSPAASHPNRHTNKCTG